MLKKALRKAVEDELDEMAAVQAFEVSYELAWHTLQKILNQQGAQFVACGRLSFSCSMRLFRRSLTRIW